MAIKYEYNKGKVDIKIYAVRNTGKYQWILYVNGTTFDAGSTVKFIDSFREAHKRVPSQANSKAEAVT